jgi:NAD(P)-dependent dehydrogenase (short-subunit alcohol dehydrogenase family)
MSDSKEANEVSDVTIGALTGRVVLVTGGNAGIGLGMAHGLAHAGADLVIWGTNPEKNAAAVDALSIHGVRVHAERCDVSDEAEVSRAFGASIEELGRLDACFANAGISGYGPSIADMTLTEWRRVLAVNLDGTFLTLRAAAAHLVEQGEGGALVAVSSTSAIHGAPVTPHYAASKAGVLGLMRALAVQLARHRIRVNALVPGWTDTDLLSAPAENPGFVENTIKRTPARRWAAAAEFGPVVAWLADPEQTFHTGDTVVVDGGYTIF